MIECCWIAAVCQGMEYLHESPVGPHGHLTSSNCVIDRKWECKITDYGLKQFKRTKNQEITTYRWNSGRPLAVHAILHPSTSLAINPSISIHPSTLPSFYPFAQSHSLINSSIPPSVKPPTNSFMHPCIIASIHPSVHPTIHPPIHPSIHPLPTHPRTQPPIHPSIHPSIHQFIQPSIPFLGVKFFCDGSDRIV